MHTPASRMNRGLFTALAMTLPAAVLAAVQATGFAASYAYTLSSLTGRIASGWLELSYDPQAHEIYTVSGGMVRVFNRAGLEIYAFGQNEALGGIEGVAVLDDGDLVVLSDMAEGWVLSRCDSRGEFLGRIVPSSTPAGFRPDTMVHANGLIYLASRGAMQVLVIEPSGAVVAFHDLAERLGFDEKKRNDTGISGFNVDRHGNLLLTIASLFKAYVVPPEGEVRSFGKAGRGPGPLQHRQRHRRRRARQPLRGRLAQGRGDRVRQGLQLPRRVPRHRVAVRWPAEAEVHRRRRWLGGRRPVGRRGGRLPGRGSVVRLRSSGITEAVKTKKQSPASRGSPTKQQRVRKFTMQKRLSSILRLVAAAALAFGFSQAYAFHSGGVAECSGCHSMHSPAAGGSFLLVGSDQSSTCLSCHGAGSGQSSYHVATNPLPASGIPAQMTPGGDFSWVSMTFTYLGRAAPRWLREGGETHGHNIVAADFAPGFTADPVNTTAPGGTFSASQPRLPELP